MLRRNFLEQCGIVSLYGSLFSALSCVNTTQIELVEITVDSIGKSLEDGAFTIAELTKACLDRIDAIDKNGPAIHSVIHVNDDVMRTANILDDELAKGLRRGPLHGIPVMLKDNIDTFDMPTTAGSRALMNSIPPDDAFIVQKLREAGAVILGKTNLSEWANFRGQRSSSGWSGLGGLTKNPYVLDRNTCGSSAGSGAAVAASLCVIAIGTETNGSIVCPSTTNGIVGIKPTVGLLSRDGIIPISFTQDTAGPMARTVRDAAICLGILGGRDTSDSKTQVEGARFFSDYTPFLDPQGLSGRRLGHYTSSRGRHKEVDVLMDRALNKIVELGAEVIEVDRISENNVSSDSFNIMLFEYKDGLNKYFASLGKNAPVKSVEELIAFNRRDSIELEFFGQEYLEQALEKGDLDSPEYLESLSRMIREITANGIDRIIGEQNLDAFIAPTGGPAWKTDLINGDHFILGSSSPAAQAGYPNITVPMGFVSELPVGISFFGTAWSEPELIAMAYAYEQASQHRRAPKYLLH